MLSASNVYASQRASSATLRFQQKMDRVADLGSLILLRDTVRSRTRRIQHMKRAYNVLNQSHDAQFTSQLDAYLLRGLSQKAFPFRNEKLLRLSANSVPIDNRIVNKASGDEKLNSIPPPKVWKPWHVLSPVEKIMLLAATAQWWEGRPFPYFPTTSSWRRRKWVAMRRAWENQHTNALSSAALCTRTSLSHLAALEDPHTRVFKAGNSAHNGSCLGSSYHPHMFHTTRRQGDPSPAAAFYGTRDDNSRRLKVIHSLLRSSSRMPYSACRFGISPSRMRAGLTARGGAKGVSNFRPLTAAAIYRRFLALGMKNETHGQGAVVWDMCAGWGGRLLGAALCSCIDDDTYPDTPHSLRHTLPYVAHYIGTEPSTQTYQGLCCLRRDLEQGLWTSTLKNRTKMKISLYQCGSEDFGRHLKPNSLDLCFTSPPYYNTELYTMHGAVTGDHQQTSIHGPESSQSYIKFPSLNEWKQGFLMETLQHCCKGLKRGRYLVLNVPVQTRTWPNAMEDVITCVESIRVPNTIRAAFVLEDIWWYDIPHSQSVSDGSKSISLKKLSKKKYTELMKSREGRAIISAQRSGEPVLIFCKR